MAMRKKNSDLHGNAPDRSAMVLLILDLISDFEFEDGREVCKAALPNCKPHHGHWAGKPPIPKLQCAALIGSYFVLAGVPIFEELVRTLTPKVASPPLFDNRPETKEARTSD